VLRFDRRRVDYFSWFTREGWERLAAVSSDDNFDVPYDQWAAGAERGIVQLTNLGFTVIKRDIDVDELLDWCKKRRRRFNSKSLARFLSEKHQD